MVSLLTRYAARQPRRYLIIQSARIFLATGRLAAWAVLHTIKRHGGKVEDVVILEVDVPRGWLRRNRSKLWNSINDVPADRIRRTISFAEMAGPNIDDGAEAQALALSPMAA
jgi:hypothetical protein